LADNIRLKAGQILFKYRSYTPIIFLVIMVLFIIPNVYSLIFGFIISILGEIIRLWAVSYAGSETRTTSVGGTYLVTQGPFAFVRNPLYIGNITIYIGLGIMSFSLFPYLQIAGLIYFSFQYFFIVGLEEDFLLNKFEDKYIIYKKYVNRFLPKFAKLPEELKSKLPFNIKAGFLSEKRSIQAIIFSYSIIILDFILKIHIL
jgi:protein-S-isoprenylcysteine O-methyltransferase Ste14